VIEITRPMLLNAVLRGVPCLLALLAAALLAAGQHGAALVAAMVAALAGALLMGLALLFEPALTRWASGEGPTAERRHASAD
jgi:ABC-type thiamin/hydroxymethylpyrimidine transport system permease subunit